MLPFGHAAVGYVCYAAYSLSIRRRIPDLAATVAVVVGALFPDVIDKPLSFFGVVPSGRSLGHSLPFAALLVVAGWYVARRTGYDRLVGAFLVGHLSHLPADGYKPLLAGRIDQVGYLFWPVVPARRYALDGTAPWERLADIAPTTHVLLQVGIAVAALGLYLWLRRRRTAGVD